MPAPSNKIVWKAESTIPDADLQRNKAYSHGLGLPLVSSASAVARPLAVLGGGPSLIRHLDELRAFDGDIWAINGAFKWARAHGLAPKFFTIDPSPSIVKDCEGARHAILADIVDRSVFDALSKVIVELFPIEKACGTTSATSAPMIAAMRGHSHVTFYGCESSYAPGNSHAYPETTSPSVLEVECGGRTFITGPQMIMQAECMAELVNGLPNYITVKGDGFLPALIQHGDYRVMRVSRDIHDKLKAAA